MIDDYIKNKVEEHKPKSFDKYCISNGLTLDPNKHHGRYWDDIYVPLYVLEYTKYFKSKNIYDFVNVLINDSDFFDKILEYMTNVGWTYGSDKTNVLLVVLKCILQNKKY